MDKKYDIFISYRRGDSKEAARILQLKLEELGYHVFLDFDELRDGRFGEKILDAIERASVFLVLLSEESMRRCANDGDWVCTEIRHAIKCEKKIIPVVINDSFTNFPNETPADIREALCVLQYSHIDTETLLNESINKMVNDRIAPIAKPRRKTWSVVLSTTGLLLIASLVIWFAVGKNTAIDPTSEFEDAADSIFLHSFVPKETQDKIFACLAESMVDIEGGEFRMKLSYERNDTITRKFDSENQKTCKVASFRLSKYEVTQELWKVVMGTTPSQFTGAKHPVEMVSFEDCQSFVRKLNDLTGKHYRIPTEEEWAFAAIGGTKSKNYLFSGGNNLNDVAWNTHNSEEKTHPVGLKTPNELGLYDMCGNVWEWTNSRREVEKDQIGIYIIRRGGSWTCDEQCCLFTTRDFKPSSYKSQAIGLRLAE